MKRSYFYIICFTFVVIMAQCATIDDTRKLFTRKVLTQKPHYKSEFPGRLSFIESHLSWGRKVRGGKTQFNAIKGARMALHNCEKIRIGFSNRIFTNI